jgi:hypothetical protein
MIRITSKKDGFRRCGIAHPSKPTEYPNDRFGEKQLAALRTDTMLIVDVIPDIDVIPDKREKVGTADNPEADAGTATEDTDISGKEAAKPGKKGNR